MPQKHIVVLLAFVGFFLMAEQASAGEQTLWRTAHVFSFSERNTQARIWNQSFSDMYDSCERGEATKTALGRARVSGRFLKTVKFILGHWEYASRALGYDTTCDIATKFSRVGFAIGAIGQFCGTLYRCPTSFTVIERETKETLRYRPDICRWRIGLGGEPQAKVIIRTPCS